MSSQVMLGQTMPGQTVSGQIISGRAESGQTVSNQRCQVKQCTRSNHTTSNNVRTKNVRSNNVRSNNVRPNNVRSNNVNVLPLTHIKKEELFQPSVTYFDLTLCRLKLITSSEWTPCVLGHTMKTKPSTKCTCVAFTDGCCTVYGVQYFTGGCCTVYGVQYFTGGAVQCTVYSTLQVVLYSVQCTVLCRWCCTVYGVQSVIITIKKDWVTGKKVLHRWSMTKLYRTIQRYYSLLLLTHPSIIYSSKPTCRVSIHTGSSLQLFSCPLINLSVLLYLSTPPWN